ncbi:MAG: hypothetical protein K8S99_17065 [Planctomycetes bacterium]|nr:hypothetical protein [Planctomycetota bacterium]
MSDSQQDHPLFAQQPDPVAASPLPPAPESAPAPLMETPAECGDSDAPPATIDFTTHAAPQTTIRVMTSDNSPASTDAPATVEAQIAAIVGAVIASAAAYSVEAPATPASPTATAETDAAESILDAPPRRGGRLAWLFDGDDYRSPTDGAPRVLVAGRIVMGIITVGLLALLGRVVELQTRPPKPIAALVDSQTSKIELLGRHGTIRDRFGRPLAIARPGKRLFIDPMEIDNLNTFPNAVSEKLGYDSMLVSKRMAGRMDSQYVVLDRRMSDDRVDKTRDLKLDGLGVETYLVRDYPQGNLAAQLIGFVNRDGKGLEGVERMFDKDLRGRPGSIGFLRDAQRRPLWIESNSYRAPEDGSSVRLSIDLIVQSIAETELAKTCKEFEAQSGEVVVMDPATGEILAMASYPVMDANNYGNTSPELRRIRAITDTYEPGSTFKPFIWAPALEQGIIRPNEMFDCTTSGTYQFASGRRLRDAHACGLLTADGVLIKSSNIGMGKIGERMGKEKLYSAIKSFGFGDSTRTGLPGEVRGRVWPLKMWSGYSSTSVTMGQEVTVTPLQIARAFCTFANGGLLVSPTIRARDDSPLGQRTPVYQRVLQTATAEHAREVLRRVVTEGTGKHADSPLYTIFGKTGTAQVADKKAHGYIPDAYTSSFICGAPMEQPRLVIACVIHRPNRRKGYFGGIVAAPAARRIIEQSLIYMGVQPDPVQPKDAKVAMRFDD